MKTTMKTAMAVLAGSLALGAMAGGPAISDVVVRQRWPWSRLVDIHYVLDCDVTQSMDVAVTAYDSSSKLTLPTESLSGDLYSVSRGARRIVWDPTKTAYTNAVMPQFRVSLTPTNPPLYMIVDLTASAGAANQVEYVYPNDARLETVGRWTNVWLSVTNDTLYKSKTSKLVLKRIHAGTFRLGGSGAITNVPKEFYMGVFEVTREQWKKVNGSYPGGYTIDGAARPSPASYNAIRGATNDAIVIDWPATGAAVGSNSFLRLLRTKTGMTGFELPTSSQWEYACRAGTASIFNDGDTTANVNGANANTNSWLALLGRYRWNGGWYWNGSTWIEPGAGTVGPTNGTAIVGSYLPNNWGLYDMHGNEVEWCINWDASAPGLKRVVWGGAYVDIAVTCVSAHSELPHIGYNCYGFRLILVLP